MLHRSKTVASLPDPRSKVSIRRSKSTNTSTSASTSLRSSTAYSRPAIGGLSNSHDPALTAAQRAMEGDHARQSCEIGLQHRCSGSDFRSQISDPRESRRRSISHRKSMPSTRQSSPHYQPPFRMPFAPHMERCSPAGGTNFDSDTIRRRKSMACGEPMARAGNRRAENRKCPSEYSISEHEYQHSASRPSSYRRLARSQSSLSLSTVTSFGPHRTTFGSERSTSPTKLDPALRPKSFLRGGTEFMPESLKRQQEQAAQKKERRSFYMSSAARQALPAIYLNEKPQAYNHRFSVKKTARHLSQSVFSSVKSIFGRTGERREDEPIRIPEQHISSSKLHFRDYVSPEEVYEDFSQFPPDTPTGPRPKIRSNYVVHQTPTLHFVPSCERIRSDVGSIVGASPPVPGRTAGRACSGATVTSIGTAATTNWNDTVDSRFTAAVTERLESIRETTRQSAEATGGSNTRRGQSGRLNVDVRRLYSALVKKLDDDPPKLKSIPKPEQGETGIGLGISAAEPTVSSGRQLLRRISKSMERLRNPSNDVHPSSGVDPGYGAIPETPPVPVIPKMWLHADSDHGAQSGARREGAAGHADNRPPRMPVSVLDSPSVYSQPSPCAPGARYAARMAQNSSIDAALSASHLQALKARNPFARNTASMSEEQPPAGHPHCQPPLPPRPVRSRKESSDVGTNAAQPSDLSGVARRRSLAEYRNANAATPVGFQRTKTAGLQQPRSGTPGAVARGGLKIMDVNLSNSTETAYGGGHNGVYRPPLRPKESKVSFRSGRQSRASMKDFDVGQAVANQFGPVIEKPREWERYERMIRRDHSNYSNGQAFI